SGDAEVHTVNKDESTTSSRSVYNAEAEANKDKAEISSSGTANKTYSLKDYWVPQSNAKFDVNVQANKEQSKFNASGNTNHGTNVSSVDATISTSEKQSTGEANIKVESGEVITGGNIKATTDGKDVNVKTTILDNNILNIPEGDLGFYISKDKKGVMHISKDEKGVLVRITSDKNEVEKGEKAIEEELRIIKGRAKEEVNKELLRRRLITPINYLFLNLNDNSED
ncbi:MAG: hypothetical protein LBE20_04130, partial [Deltaproteobacteria bacterium]|nr:hypothetical protein [Deltaproteobacteria bacterium]